MAVREQHPEVPSQPAFGAAHAWQGLLAFLTGGLSAAVVMMAAGLQDGERVQAAGQVVGYVLGGALGGAGLAWGFPGRRAWLRGAGGFGAGFLLPAFLAAPALLSLLTMEEGEGSAAGVFVATVFAYGGGYAVGGAVGMSAIAPRLGWTGAIRFLAAGAAGGCISAGGAAWAGTAGGGASPAAAMLAIGFALGGHLTAFALGGFLAGRALEAEFGRSDRHAPSPAPARG